MKVTRKVGRRSRSSISRRRFRNNKNKKSSYKKRYGKTHKGGCWSGAKKGGARSRKYGHKRGKRFHRGGVGSFGDDIEPGSRLEPTISSISTFDIEALPKNLRSLDRMDNTLSFEYKRTDGIYAFNPISETGVFDVAVSIKQDDFRILQGIYLVRHNKNDMTMSDKYLTITGPNWQTYNSEKPFTGIKGFTTNGIDNSQDGTYTFPPSITNNKSFGAVKDFLNTLNLTA